MKSFKCLLTLPVAIVALAACGKSEVNFKEADLAAAKEIADSYATTITDSKASDIVVSGHVNKLTLDGDATWWHYTPIESNAGKIDASAGGVKVKKKNLLMMIPNFSVKDSHISVDPHDIATFTMPGSLVSLGESVMDEVKSNKSMAITLLANLPKFPMNTRLLRAISGLKKLPEDVTEEEWNKIEDEAWTKANVSYFTSGSRLKVTLSTDDFEAFMDEFGERYRNVPSDNVRASEKKYPASFTITTSEIGYIDSFSVNFKLENIDEKKETEALYYSIKGNMEVDLALKFEQVISDPITIKYQLSVYHLAKKDETPDVQYYTDTTGPVPLVYDKEKSKPLTTDLSTFSDYLTFDWFSNTKLLNPDIIGSNAPLVLTKVYDDPIFCYNYWNTKEKNIAFSNESYDVLAIPKYTIDEVSKEAKLKCRILGGVFHTYNELPRMRSMVTTSIDGRVISANSGLYSNRFKILNTAGDAVHNNTSLSLGENYQPIVIKDKEDKQIIVPIDELFINSNFLSAKDSEYIINIPVAIEEAE